MPQLSSCKLAPPVMRLAVFVLLHTMLVLPAALPQSDPTARGSADRAFGVFEGRTPCGALANDFTGAPASDCLRIKWRLTLYRDSGGRATRYSFSGIAVGDSDARLSREGPWRSESGTDQGRVIFKLEYGKPAKVLSLLSIDDNVLLLLDPELRVLVGDASWSYALNRMPTPAR